MNHRFHRNRLAFGPLACHRNVIPSEGVIIHCGPVFVCGRLTSTLGSVLPCSTLNAEVPMAKIQQILVPVDFSECSIAALEQALALGAALGAKVEVLHTYDVPTFLAPNVVVFAGEFEAPLVDHAEKYARHQLDLFARKMGLSDNPMVSTSIVMGPAAATILDVAEQRQPDLLVVGTHGRTGVERVLMGSTAEKVLRNAKCPVLAVKAPAPPAGGAS